SALITFRQWLGAADSIYEVHLFDSRPTANLGQPNLLATLLMLGACGALFLHQQRAFAGWVALLVVAVLLAAAALTLSRTAWLFAGLAFVYLHWRMRRGDLRLPRWVPLALLGFFAACVLLVGPAAERFGPAGGGASERMFTGGRLSIW